MGAWRLFMLLSVAWIAMAGAQTPESTGVRGSIPPGTSRDDSRPSEGAIEGGSVGGREPGAPVLKSGRALQKETNRCKQLKGVLRDQCLNDLGKASARGTRPPPAGTERGPTAPPPQEPQPQ